MSIELLEGEEFRVIEGYEEYSVSNYGRVVSIDRITSHNRKIKGRVYKTPNDTGGYPVLALCKGGKVKRANVHRLVAKAFIANPLGKKEVNHIDGVRHNNIVSNLEWCTREENIRHAFANIPRNTVRGERMHTSKLKEKQVYEIRQLRSMEYSQKCIAATYKVSESVIAHIHQRRLWDHLPKKFIPLHELPLPTCYIHQRKSKNSLPIKMKM